VFRDQGKIGSVYDSNVTSFDPFPYSPDRRSSDPILAPTTTAMVNFLTTTVGWKVNARYNALAHDVNRLWDGGDDLRKGSVDDLREAVFVDPKIRADCSRLERFVMPLHGILAYVDQMPIMGDLGREAVREYPGGHMFDTRPTSRDALRKDVMEIYRHH
jgi:carboxypeptidase C (cathepsin A)